MKLPFDFNLEKPIFEIISKNQYIKIYANGKTEGIDEPHSINNGFAALICQYNAYHEVSKGML